MAEALLVVADVFHLAPSLAPQVEHDIFVRDTD